VNPTFDPGILTQEKKLWDIYVASRCIPLSRFNFWSTTIVCALLTANTLISSYTLTDTIVLVREASTTGLVLSLSTLGFLIAGFTIFATITQPDLSLALAQVPERKTNLPYLKYTYFLFLRVFIYYLAFAAICLLIVMFGHSGGLLAAVLSLLPNAGCIQLLLVKLSYVVVYTGYFFLVVQLKSFIYNIYMAVMTSLRWQAEKIMAEEESAEKATVV